MRVLLLSWEFPPKVFGGLGRHVAALSRTLVAQGHEVHVVTGEVADRPREEWVDGIHVIRAPEAPPVVEFGDLVPWVLAFNNSLQTVATRFLLEHEVDVVHAHDWLVAYAAVGLKQAFELPLVATVHATESGRHQGWLPGPTNRFIHQVEWWLTFEARRVITCSRYMRDQVETSFMLPPDKIDVVPNGVAMSDFKLPAAEVAAFRGSLLKPDERMVLFAGRLEYEKGVHTVLRAMQRVLREAGPVRLFIAGVGTYEDELRNLVKRLRLARRVVFTGFLEDHDLRLHYSAADVAVAPSIYEPFGLVAIEAMACGTPVVVGDTGGLREIVGDGLGLRFEPGDPVGLADALITVLADPALAQRMVAKARRSIPSRYDWGRVTGRTVAVYERATREERESAGTWPRLASNR